MRSAWQRWGWTTFLRAAVHRYGPHGAFWREHPDLPFLPIRNWEIWNEENIVTFNGRPDPVGFASLIRISGRILHHADPGSKVILGGLFGRPLQIPPNVGSGDFLSRVYRAHNVKRYFDGVALHPYVARARAMGAQLTNLRRIMRVHNDDATPIYVTELGWGSSSGPTRWERGLWGQADQLSQSFALLSANRLRWGVAGAWWFTWTDEGGTCQLLHFGRAADREARSEALLVPLQRLDRGGRGHGAAGEDRHRRAAGSGRTRGRSQAARSRRAGRRIDLARPEGSAPLGSVFTFELEPRSHQMPFSVPDLPYAYDALEPHIDEATMRVHHDKHHQAYVDKANAALEGTEWADRDVEDVLKNLSSLPADKQGPVRNNAGGHYNHSLFWQMMSPDGGGEPQGELAAAIDDGLRLLRRLQGGVQKRRDRPLRLRLGLAGQGLLGQPRGRLDPEPGRADLRRRHAAARRRRLGARLLPQVPEQAPRIPRRLLERRQLGLRRPALRGLSAS